MGFSKCLPCRRAFSSLPPQLSPPLSLPLSRRCRQLASIFTDTRSFPSPPPNLFYLIAFLSPSSSLQLFESTFILDRSIDRSRSNSNSNSNTFFSLSLPRKREREERNFDFRLALFLLFPRFPFSPFPSSLPPPVFPARYGRVIYEHCICSLFV